LGFEDARPPAIEAPCMPDLRILATSLPSIANVGAIGMYKKARMHEFSMEGHRHHPHFIGGDYFYSFAPILISTMFLTFLLSFAVMMLVLRYISFLAIIMVLT
jgi:hypothetical protein